MALNRRQNHRTSKQNASHVALLPVQTIFNGSMPIIADESRFFFRHTVVIVIDFLIKRPKMEKTQPKKNARKIKRRMTATDGRQK